MSTSEQLQALLARFRKEQLPEIEAAAADGDPQAQFELGALYANGRGVNSDFAQAAEWLRRAADQGWYAAQTLLGWLYLNGHGVPGNPVEARNWYARAATAGDMDAQCALGDLCRQGAPGLEPDAAAMLRWYEHAARQGHPKAQYMLGKLLADGTQVPEDAETAFQWLTLAVLNDSEPARKELQLLTARLGPLAIEQYKQRMMQSMSRQQH